MGVDDVEYDLAQQIKCPPKGCDARCVVPLRICQAFSVRIGQWQQLFSSDGSDRVKKDLRQQVDDLCRVCAEENVVSGEKGPEVRTAASGL